MSSSRWRHATLVATASAALAAVGMAGCASPSTPEPPSETLTIAVSSFFFADPPAHTVPFLPVDAIYETLVRGDQAKDEYIPYLAESVELSDDRRTMTVELPSDVYFTDGTLLTADVVKEFLDAIYSDPDFFWNPAAVAAGLEIHVVDEDTLEFQADIPITPAGVPLLVGLGSPEPYFASPETAKDNPVGTGPYLLEESVPEVSATLVRNPDYWNAEEAEFEKLVYQVYTDPVAALNALKSGQIDAAEIPANFVQEAEDSGLSIFMPESFINNSMLVIYDTAGAMVPALADVRVRQAMAFAFDRAAIVENVQNGYGGDSSQVFPVGHPGYLEGEDDHYAFDLDRARELMAEAGYEDGFDITIPKIADGVNSQYSSANEAAVQQALADIGIRVTFEMNETAFFAQEITYPVLLFQHNWLGVVAYLSPGASANWSPLLDSEGTELLDAARTAGRDESAAAWHDFAQRLLDEAWVIPVSQVPTGIWATRDGLEIEMPANLGGYVPFDWIHRS